MQKKVFVLAYLFICPDCLAQQYPFVHYTPEDGLVNGRVRSAYQDSRGQMYFLTYGGLSVYDGTRFTNYTAQDGLAVDVVNDVMEMGEDSLWIACNQDRLSYLKNKKIKPLLTADGFCPLINKLIKTADGNIYAAADDGLFLFRNNRFLRQPLQWEGDTVKYLSAIIEWENFLLISTDLSLAGSASANFYVYDRQTGKVIAETKERIGGVCISPDKKIFISGTSSMLQLDGAALKQGIIRYLPLPAKYKNLEQPSGFMFFDKQHALWVFYHPRIICVDAAGNTKQFTVESGLASDNFSNIFQDRENIIWITMSGAGVDKLASQNVELIKQVDGGVINNLYADESSDSVYMYTAAKKRFNIFDTDGLVKPLYPFDNLTNFSFKVRNEKIFVSDASRLTLLKQEGSGQLSQTLLYEKEDVVGLGEYFFDPYDNLIVSAPPHLVCILGNNKTYKVPMYYTDQIAFDKQGRLWTAARDGMFYILQVNPAQPGNYLQLLNSFRYDSVFKIFSARALALDGYNNVWLGTRYSGLYCLQFDKNLQLTSYQHYTLKEGLSDNFITHLVADKENNVWASTASGLDKIYFDGSRYHIENVTRSSHLYKYIYKTFISRSGIVWSHTSDNDVIRIDNRIALLKRPPEFFITALKVRDSAFSDFLSKGDFRYSQNTFSVSVASPSFYDERGIKYSYMLQGGNSNESWSEPSNNSTFNFIGLTPRQYNLKLKAQYPGGSYPEQIIEYAFVIRPPWWQTWWFRTVAGLMIIGLLIIVFRFYYRRKLESQKLRLEKQQAVEKERTRIATDIHDDLGSGLSRIRYLGETIRHKGEQQENIIPDIEKIAKFSDEMVDKMNEIIWALNEKNDSLEAMVSYIRSFTVEYLTENNIKSRVELPENIPACIVNGETRRNIFLSVKECLHNIVKHAEASEASLSISLNYGLLIKINDNGKGIDWGRMRPFSNGIMNIKKRMQEAGGTAEFGNEMGTTVILKTPLL